MTPDTLSTENVDLVFAVDEPLTKSHVRVLTELVENGGDQGRPGLLLSVTGTPQAAIATKTDIKTINRWERALRRLERFKGPVVVGAVGSCGGAAAEVLLCGDQRIVTNDFSLLLPETRSGLWPGMLTYRITQQIGPARARRLALESHRLDGDRCLELGLVDSVVEDLRESLDERAALLAEVDPYEFAIRRQLLLDAVTTPFDVALGRHLAACERALRLHREGEGTR